MRLKHPIKRGIGGADGSSDTTVGIHGGTITATGGNGGAGIGNGYNGNDTTISIDADKADLDVTATVRTQPKGAFGSWGGWTVTSPATENSAGGRNAHMQ